nr:MAG TPA: hypothetical protein [Inoviridae sp.]
MAKIPDTPSTSSISQNKILHILSMALPPFYFVLW